MRQTDDTARCLMVLIFMLAFSLSGLASADNANADSAVLYLAGTSQWCSASFQTTEAEVLLGGVSPDGADLATADALCWAMPLWLDTAPPGAPDVSGDALTNDPTPTWTWTGSLGGSGAFRYSFDGGDWVETTETSYTPVSALADGSYILEVQERDGSWNWSDTGSFTIEIDTTPPDAPSVTGDTPTYDTTPTWSWTSGGGNGSGTYRYAMDVESGWTETTDLSYTPGTPVTEAPHTLYVQERDDAGNWSESGSFAIVQLNDPPAIGVNTVATVLEGGAALITSARLSGLDPDDSGAGLVFTITSGPLHGQVELTTAPNAPVSSFTQADIDANTVLYRNNGDEATSDSFSFSLADGGEDDAAPATGDFLITVTPVNDSPVVSVNTGAAVVEGQAVTLNNSMLRVADPDDDSASITYTITASPAHGWLRRAGTLGASIKSFTQAELDAGAIVYTHNGTETTADSFSFSAADGGEDGAVPATGVFTITVTPANDGPVVSVNTGASVLNSQSVVITGAMLQAMDTDSAVEGLVYMVTTAPVKGQVEAVSNPGVAISTFTQTDINAGLVQYAHNGSAGTLDTFRFSVSDGGADGALPALGIFRLTILPTAQAPVVSAPESTPELRPTWTWVSGGNGVGQYRYALDSAAGPWTETTALQYQPLEDLSRGNHTLYVQEQGLYSEWSASGSATVLAGVTYTISGHVSLQDAGSVTAAKVILSGDADAETSPDATGAYSFADLEAGRYEVRVELWTYRFQPDKEVFDSLDADQEDVDFEGSRSLGLSVPYFQDNAPAEGLTPGSSGSQAFIGVKNLVDAPNTLTIYYTNLNGEDRTPDANTYVLNAYEGLSWRPCRNDAAIEGVAAAIPDMTTGFMGNAMICSTGPIAGRLLAIASNGSQSAYTLPGMQGSEQLIAPFFMDSSPVGGEIFPTKGMSTYLGILNTDTAAAQLRVWYANITSVDQTPALNGFDLQNWMSFSYRPTKDDPNLEGLGVSVPNMMAGGIGSAFITGGRYLAGRVLCLAKTGGQYAYTMSGEGATSLVVPYFMDNAPVEGSIYPSMGSASYIGVKNLSNAPVTLTISYTTIGNVDATPAVNTYTIPARGSASWRPARRDPAIEYADVPDMALGVGGSAVITATGSIAGRLLTISSNGSMSAYTLQSTAGENVLAAPYFHDNAPADGAYPPVLNASSFIGVKNLTADPVTLTLRYRNGAGADRTPLFNTYVLPGNASVSWRPTRNDPAVEGGAAAVPDMTSGGVGSAIIESTGPIAGRLLTVSPNSQSAYELPSGNE